MLKNQPEKVVDAIKEIMKSSTETVQQEQQVTTEKLNRKYENMKPVQEIVGLLKAMDKADKANQEVKKQKAKELTGNQHKLDKNKNGKLDSQDFKMLRKEEAETEIRDEKTKAVLKRARDVHGKDVEIMGKVAAMMKKEKEMKLAKEEAETVDEARFKKGQDVGKPGMMFGKIAAKAAKKYGSMEAGKRVAGAVLKKVLAKKAMKEELDLEEGRGRPRKNPSDPKWQKKPAEGEDHENLAPDSGKEADQHIHVRLKQVADSSEKGGAHIKFDNNKTHFVKQHVAQHVLSSLDKMKPDVRAKVHDHIQKSHENLMQVHTMLAGKK